MAPRTQGKNGSGAGCRIPTPDGKQKIETLQIGKEISFDTENPKKKKGSGRNGIGQRKKNKEEEKHGGGVTTEGMVQDALTTTPHEDFFLSSISRDLMAALFAFLWRMAVSPPSPEAERNDAEEVKETQWTKKEKEKEDQSTDPHAALPIVSASSSSFLSDWCGAFSWVEMQHCVALHLDTPVLHSIQRLHTVLSYHVWRQLALLGEDARHSPPPPTETVHAPNAREVCPTTKKKREEEEDKWGGGGGGAHEREEEAKRLDTDLFFFSSSFGATAAGQEGVETTDAGWHPHEEGHGDDETSLPQNEGNASRWRTRMEERQCCDSEGTISLSSSFFLDARKDEKGEKTAPCDTAMSVFFPFHSLLHHAFSVPLEPSSASFLRSSLTTLLTALRGVDCFLRRELHAREAARLRWLALLHTEKQKKKKNEDEVRSKRAFSPEKSSFGVQTEEETRMKGDVGVLASSGPVGLWEHCLRRQQDEWDGVEKREDDGRGVGKIEDGAASRQRRNDGEGGGDTAVSACHPQKNTNASTDARNPFCTGKASTALLPLSIPLVSMSRHTASSPPTRGTSPRNHGRRKSPPPLPLSKARPPSGRRLPSATHEGPASGGRPKSRGAVGRSSTVSASRRPLTFYGSSRKRRREEDTSDSDDEEETSSTDSSSESTDA